MTIIAVIVQTIAIVTCHSHLSLLRFPFLDISHRNIAIVIVIIVVHKWHELIVMYVNEYL